MSDVIRDMEAAPWRKVQSGAVVIYRKAAGSYVLAIHVIAGTITWYVFEK